MLSARKLSTGAVPRLSAFYGMVVFMPTNDHDPPHFHVKRAEHAARVVIATGQILPGATLSNRAIRLVNEWRRLHIDELFGAWNALRAGRVPPTIEPLE